VLARAAREPRVIAGVLFVLAAIVLGYAEYRHVRGEADRDFAHCAQTPPPSDCQTKRRPLALLTTRSSGDAFRAHHSLQILTGPNTTLTLRVSSETASHFDGQSSADVRYRHGHASAILADDGTALEVPFIFSVHLAEIGAIAIGLLMLGGGLLAWGLTHVNRSPRTA
jgi:hypothetical protein